MIFGKSLVQFRLNSRNLYCRKGAKLLVYNDVVHVLFKAQLFGFHDGLEPVKSLSDKYKSGKNSVLYALNFLVHPS